MTDYQKQIKTLNRLQTEIETFRIQYYPVLHKETHILLQAERLIDKAKDYITLVH